LLYELTDREKKPYYAKYQASVLCYLLTNNTGILINLKICKPFYSISLNFTVDTFENCNHITHKPQLEFLNHQVFPTKTALSLNCSSTFCHQALYVPSTLFSKIITSKVREIMYRFQLNSSPKCITMCKFQISMFRTGHMLKNRIIHIICLIAYNTSSYPVSSK